jgi:hypothetical protein
VWLLRAAGASLVAADPLAPADAVVVAIDAGDAGVLEAADLVRQGMAARVAVLSDAPTPAERELARRGVPYEDAAAVAVRRLASLGVPTAERIPAPVDGSHGAGPVLRDWCARGRIASLIVVSGADHARRVRRVLRRAMRGAPVTIIVRPARYSAFDPRSWWTTRAGVRMGIVEFEKLLLDVVTHPWP